jgi:SAM-dependent methyltransferase
MRESERLTDVDYWVDHQGAEIPGLPNGGAKPSWFKHVRRELPTNPGASCIEIGVVPGDSLLYLGSHLPLRTYGIDFSPRVRDLRRIFDEQGVQAELYEADFLSWSPDRKFDLVYSKGFVEHFADYSSVIQRHWDLVKPGGILVVVIPVFTPFQLFVRKIFYEPSKWEEIRQSHNSGVTRQALEGAAGLLTGGKVVKSGYINEMRIWFTPKESGVRRNLQPLYLALKGLELVFRRLGISSRWYSPEFFVLVRREGQP